MASPMIDTEEVDIVETYAKSGVQAQTLRLMFMRGEIPRLMSEDRIIAICEKADLDNNYGVGHKTDSREANPRRHRVAWSRDNQSLQRDP